MPVRILNYRESLPADLWVEFSKDLAREDVLKIGTHDGQFHADEVLGCVQLLELFEPSYEYIVIVRTRNQHILNKCAIVLDVGEIYDDKIFRYDHHQRNFNLHFPSVTGIPIFNNTVKLSSAGLIYCSYGRKLIAQRLGLDLSTDAYKSDERVKLIFKKLYENFIIEIDALDNGATFYPFSSQTNLTSRVNYLNFDNELANPFMPDPQIALRFLHALNIVKEEFCAKLTYYVSEWWWKARNLTKDALESRKSIHESGEIIAFNKDAYAKLPWKDHLPELEYFGKCQGDIKFVITKLPTADGVEAEHWKIRAVNKSVAQDGGKKTDRVTPHTARILLKKNWRGEAGSQLQKLSGVSDAMWVQPNGMIGKAASYGGALSMAIKSLRFARTGNEKMIDSNNNKINSKNYVKVSNRYEIP